MENRRRFMMAANALLYFGPLLAGLGGFGWGYVPVFALLFVLWLVILQPMEFPINKAEWLSADAWVAVSARAVVQLLLVLILFGIGRGIGGVLGAMTGYSPMLPIAVSFLSIPLARMIWDPWAQPLEPQEQPQPATDASPSAMRASADPQPAANPGKPDQR